MRLFAVGASQDFKGIDVKIAPLARVFYAPHRFEECGYGRLLFRKVTFCFGGYHLLGLSNLLKFPADSLKLARKLCSGHSRTPLSHSGVAGANSRRSSRRNFETLFRPQVNVIEA